MDIRFSQNALDKLEREGFIAAPHEDDAEKFKASIMTFLGVFTDADIALIQPSTWSNQTLRFILDIDGHSIHVADVEVIDA